jgi:hypothetical protein
MHVVLWQLALYVVLPPYLMHVRPVSMKAATVLPAAQLVGCPLAPLVLAVLSQQSSRAQLAAREPNRLLLDFLLVSLELVGFPFPLPLPPLLVPLALVTLR